MGAKARLDPARVLKMSEGIVCCTRMQIFEGRLDALKLMTVEDGMRKW